MIDFGRLRHLSPPQISVLRAANRDLHRNEAGRYVMHNAVGKPLNFAQSLLPSLTVSTTGAASTNVLAARPLGSRIMGSTSDPLWYCNVTGRIRSEPLYLRGGFARSLRKVESILRCVDKDQCAVMTTAERRERAKQTFRHVFLHTDPIPTWPGHLVVDEAHLLTRSLARAIGALQPTFKWIVSPYSKNVAQKAVTALGLPDGRAVRAEAAKDLTEAHSLARGACPICLEDDARLAVVCENGHLCCLLCSPHLSGKCMLCRQKTKLYI